MYVGTDAGVASFDPNQTTLTFTGLTGSPASVNKLVADQSAGDFYVCADNGLFKYDVAAGTFNSDVAFTGKKVLTFVRQSATVFWVGLEDLTAAATIAKVENGTASFYGTAQGITASSVAGIYIDDNMVMAAGTGDTGKGGIFRFDPSGNQFARQTVTIGLSKGATLFFKLGTNWYAGGPDSGLVVSTDNGGTWSQTNLKDCTPVDFSVENYNFIGNQRYWVASEKATYLSYDMVNFAAFTTANQLAADSSNQVYSGSTIWIAHNGGLSRMAFDGN
jgi:ligand-binding sensor domain-containing protein